MLHKSVRMAARKNAVRVAPRASRDADGDEAPKQCGCATIRRGIIRGRDAETTGPYLYGPHHSGAA
jgi:hypothetical protein